MISCEAIFVDDDEFHLFEVKYNEWQNMIVVVLAVQFAAFDDLVQEEDLTVDDGVVER